MEPNQNTSLFQLNLDAGNGYTLRSAASWAKVLGVVGVIMGILFIIVGVLVQNSMNQAGRYQTYELGSSSRTLANIGMAVYIIMGLVFVISSIFALNFGNRISRAVKANDQLSLGVGFAAARNFFAFWAIIIIIFLLLMLIGVAGLLSAAGR